MIRVIIEGLVKHYGPVAALDGASLELRAGELAYLLGPRGAGKTTMARLLAGLEQPEDGEIYFGDRMVHKLPPRERNVGMVFADLGLWPALTVVENVAYPLKAQRMERSQRRRRVSDVLTGLRIDSLAGRRPGQLTASQRLRVAIARALSSQPQLLLLDEPMRMLDPRARRDFWDDLRRFHAEAGLTTLVLTDDPHEAMALADRLAVIDLGRVIQSGVPHELYNRPNDVFVARLLGPTNLLQGQVEGHGTALSGGGEVVVRTPLGRLIGRSHSVPVEQGTPVTVTVRPETMAFGPTIPPGWNRFPAMIERIEFRGELRHIHARGPGDWPVIFSAIQSLSQNLREGQSLTLSVAPENVVILPGKFALGSN
jgi:ABC-type sugar transport system ATPase subunit